jgi:hypothetical protein
LPTSPAASGLEEAAATVSRKPRLERPETIKHAFVGQVALLDHFASGYCPKRLSARNKARSSSCKAAPCRDNAKCVRTIGVSFGQASGLARQIAIAAIVLFFVRK